MPGIFSCIRARKSKVVINSVFQSSPPQPTLVVLAKDLSPSTDQTREHQEWCKDRLQRYQYPHTIDFVEELPKTALGKIQRFKLREATKVE